MSVSYISKKINDSDSKIRDFSATNAGFTHTAGVEFTKSDPETANKSVSVSYSDDLTRIIVTFYGYEEQKQVNAILKAFKIMLNTTFRVEN